VFSDDNNVVIVFENKYILEYMVALKIEESVTQSVT
jgi:hypothetical protein